MGAEAVINDLTSAASTAQGNATNALNTLNTLATNLNSAITAATSGVGGINNSFRLDFSTTDALPEGLTAELDAYDAEAGVSVFTDLVAQLKGGTKAQVPDPYIPAALPKLQSTTFNDFIGNPPVVNTPTIPNRLTPNLPFAPSLKSPNLPNEPNLVTIDPPNFNAISIPDVAFSGIPAFTSTAPIFTYQAPSAVLSYTEDTYTSALMDAAEAWLQDVIQNGGTGLAPAVEQAIYDRAAEREVLAARKSIEAATDEFAAAGYSLPPGALRARLRAIQEDLQDRTETLNREILINQAKLAQDNSQFAITQSIQLESLKVQHFNNVAERALRVAQLTVQLGIEVFNARVLEFNTQMEGYKSEVAVFEALVRALAVEAQIEQAKLDAAKTEAEIQRIEVDVYRAQLEGQRALLDLYRAKLDAAKTQLELNAQEIEIFRAQIQAEEARLQVNKLEFDAYLAQLQGEKLKIDVYTSEVQAFETETRAKLAQQQGYIEEFKGKVLQENLQFEAKAQQLRAYIAEIEGESAVIEAAAARIDAELRRNTIRLEAIRSTVDANVAVARVNAEIASGNVAELNAISKKEGDLLLAAIQSQIAGAQAGMQAQAGVAAAAMQQVSYIGQAIGSDERLENA